MTARDMSRSLARRLKIVPVARRPRGAQAAAVLGPYRPGPQPDRPRRGLCRAGGSRLVAQVGHDRQPGGLHRLLRHQSGPIAWLIMSKICPLNVRGTAAGIATLFDWAFNLIVAMTFLALIAALGRPATFGFLSLI